MSFFYGLMLIIILSAFTVVSFLFSISETSIIGISKIKLRHMLAKNVRNSSKVQKLITNSDKLVVGILVGNNFVNIAFSAIISAIMVYFTGPRIGVILATVATTGFILVFCEILPKMIALKHTERVALAVAPLMDVYIGAVNPMVRFFTSITDIILDILRIPRTKRSSLITEEELRVMIEVGKEDGVLSEEERKMFHRIFEFGDIKAGDVMIPKDKMVAVSSTATIDDLLNILAEQGHSRIPVYRGSIEHIIGIIYARDLLYLLRDKGLFLIQDIIHPAFCVSASTRVSELLRKFQMDKIQIAVVADDKGETLGLLTLEDLLEEIVGEIEEQKYTPGNHK